jgi:hypothetical protein
VLIVVIFRGEEIKMLFVAVRSDQSLAAEFIRTKSCLFRIWRGQDWSDHGLQIRLSYKKKEEILHRVWHELLQLTYNCMRTNNHGTGGVGGFVRAEC